MHTIFQICSLAIVCILLSTTVNNRSKEIGTVLSMAGCVLILLLAGSYLVPVIDFLEQLKQLGNLNGDLVRILVKVVGISLITDITGLICGDSGNASLGKVVQISAAIVVIWLSLPVYNLLLDLISNILEAI